VSKKRYYYDIETSSLDGKVEPIRIEEIRWFEYLQRKKYRGWILMPPTILLVIGAIYLWVMVSTSAPKLMWVIWTMMGCCGWIALGLFTIFIADYKHINKKYDEHIRS
jgi:amino acid transporter